jgi:hypothetical protein
MPKRHQAADLIREIVRECVYSTHSRLSPLAHTMSEAELLGYVRARAIHIVRLESLRVAARWGVRIEHSDPLVDCALERTVYTVAHQMKLLPVVATSAAQATLRAAS